MRRLALLMCVLILPSLAGAQVAESLRGQARVRQTLLENQIQELEEMRAELRETWTRVEQQTAAMLQAQSEGESVESLRLRDADLRGVETELLASLFEVQQARAAMLENRTMIAALDAEVRRLAAGGSEAAAPLTGTWRLVVQPDQEGVAYLQQQGTLVAGTYSLSGGFSGSFRGTLVAGKVRLERIDSQIGFAAIFYGNLVGSGDNLRLQGNWEATQLASGLPSMGRWNARKVDEDQ